MSVVESGLDSVRRALQAYADRGIFRSFSETTITAHRHEFRFGWLVPQPFLLIYDRRSNILTMKDVLPEVVRKSAIDCGIRRYVSSRHSEKLPVHRRIERGKMRAYCVNPKDALSIVLKMTSDCDAVYAVNRILNLTSDVFNDFLHRPEQEAYVRGRLGIRGE